MSTLQIAIDSLIATQEATDAAALKVRDDTIAAQIVTIADLNKQIADLKAQIPAPTPVPTPTPAPAFPDATNTGPLVGTVFKPYTGPRTLVGSGLVLDGYDLSGGQLIIKAANVVIRNCLFNATSWYAIRSDDTAASGLTVERCTFKGPGTGATTDTNTAALYGRGTFTGNNISGFENGIALVGGPATVKGNFIHDLADGGGAHYDGIECHGGQHDILIEGNTVENLHTQTSCVFIKNDFGPITNVMVRGNKLSGGGYTVYVDNRGPNGGALSGISFIDNVMGKGLYGYSSLQVSVTWTGNTDAVTGKPV